MHLPSRFLLRLARGLLCLLIALPVLFGCALAYLEWKGGDLVESYLREVSRETDCEIVADDIGLTLLPIPSVRSGKLVVRRDGVQFSAAYASVRPSLLSLLKASFKPEHITLLRPRFTGTLPVPFRKLADGTGENAGKNIDWEALLPPFCSISIHDADIDLVDADSSRLSMEGLGIEATLASIIGRGRGKLTLSGLSLTLQPEKGSSLQQDDGTPLPMHWSLSGMSLEGHASLNDPLHKLDLTLRGVLGLPLLQARLTTDLHISANSRGPSAEGAFTGSYQLDGQSIPLEAEGRISPVAAAGDGTGIPGQDTARTRYRIAITHLAMGEDSAAVNAILSLDEKAVPPVPAEVHAAGNGELRGPVIEPAAPESGLSISGNISLTHLSLTRWLTFARDLTPGLQWALGDITEGTLEFSLNGKGLKVPHVTAVCSNARFSGRGGVESWAKPVIFLDLNSEKVDLKGALPEAYGTIVPAPTFAHRALTDVTEAEYFRAPAEIPAGADAPGAPASPDVSSELSTSAREKNAPSAPSAQKNGGKTATSKEKTREADRKKPAEDSFDIGYDIRLGGDTIRYGLVTFTRGRCIITPATNDQVRLDVNTRLARGRIKGYCLIGGTSEQPTFAIAAKASSVDAGQLRSYLSFIPVTRGTLAADVSVTAKGNTLDAFLATLKGQVAATGSKGMLATKEKGPGLAFQTINARLDLTRAAFQKKRIGLYGRWHALYAGEGWSGEGSMDGALWFGGATGQAGVYFEQVPASIAIKNTEKLATFLAGTGIPLGCKGRLSCKSWQDTLTLEAGKLTAPGLTGQVTCTLNCRGKEPVVSGSLQNAKLGLPEFLGANFGKKPDIPAPLRHIRGGGHYQIQKWLIKATSLDAYVDETHITGELTAQFKGQKPELGFSLKTPLLNLDRYMDEKNEGGKSKAAASEPWDLTFFREFQARGTLAASELLAGKLKAKEITAPVRLENGTLTITGLGASFYEGYLTGNGTIRFGEGLTLSSTMKAQNFDMAGAMRDRGMKSRISSRCTLETTLKSSLTGSNQMPSRLNGALSFTLGKGSYQALDDSGNPKGKPTPISKASCTGTITNGVINTKDFSLSNDGLTLTGSGTFNLNSRTMDSRMVADMRGLPEIPIHLYGSFSDPKTSINAPMVFLNTIGGLAKGIFGIIGSVVEGTINLFK